MDETFALACRLDVGVPDGFGRKRVVLDPVLTCAARGIEPCSACRDGETGRCDGITQGHVKAGLQTGYCKDTGGGWGERMVAHRSQLHPVPESLPDERAVADGDVAVHALHLVTGS